ncbi:hypothetical protein L0938_13840 [Paracidovorax citrulli]
MNNPNWLSTMELSNLSVIQQRIRGIEGQLELSLAHVKALEVGLRLSIATHSNLTNFLAALDIFEEGSDGEGPLAGSGCSANYRRAFSEGIANIRKDVLNFREKSAG